jgi:hypothetical protein
MARVPGILIPWVSSILHVIPTVPSRRMKFLLVQPSICPPKLPCEAPPGHFPSASSSSRGYHVNVDENSENMAFPDSSWPVKMSLSIPPTALLRVSQS